MLDIIMKGAPGDSAIGPPERRALTYAPAGKFRLAGEAIGPTRRPGPAEPGDVALVLHTSGTTSRPKIVPLTQANLAASAKNILIPWPSVDGLARLPTADCRLPYFVPSISQESLP